MTQIFGNHKLIYRFILILWLGIVATVTSGQPFTPETPPRPEVLMDYYHHSKPGLQIGRFVRTGEFTSNLGRYGMDDFSHPNSFDPLFLALEKEFAFYIHEEPFTAQNLENMDT